MNLDLLLQLAISGFLLGRVYSLIALGLSLLFCMMRVIDFAHGEMMVWGDVCRFFNPQLTIVKGARGRLL